MKMKMKLKLYKSLRKITIGLIISSILTGLFAYGLRAGLYYYYQIEFTFKESLLDLGLFIGLGFTREMLLANLPQDGILKMDLSSILNTPSPPPLPPPASAPAPDPSSSVSGNTGNVSGNAGGNTGNVSDNPRASSANISGNSMKHIENNCYTLDSNGVYTIKDPHNMRARGYTDANGNKYSSYQPYARNLSIAMEDTHKKGVGMYMAFPSTSSEEDSR